MTAYKDPPAPARFTAAEAKAHFAEILRRAEAGEEIIVTRHGKSVAAIVPDESVAQIQRLRAAEPKGGLASLKGGWEGSDALAAICEKIQAHRSRKKRRFRWE